MNSKKKKKDKIHVIFTLQIQTSANPAKARKGDPEVTEVVLLVLALSFSGATPVNVHIPTDHKNNSC